jgi:structural maintenance of chromosome 4
LITVSDESFRPAFYSVLRDTLFAEDINVATRISTPENSNKCWRVVTARGEVVEISGTMTGGGQKQIKYVII